MHKKLGKIASVKFGFGGYQEAQFGISFSFEGKNWGSGDFWGHWGTKRSDGCQWTEESRHKALGEVCMRLSSILSDAKVKHIDQLNGIPVEVTFDSPIGELQSWRILKEVL